MHLFMNKPRSQIRFLNLRIAFCKAAKLFASRRPELSYYYEFKASRHAANERFDDAERFFIKARKAAKNQGVRDYFSRKAAGQCQNSAVRSEFLGAEAAQHANNEQARGNFASAVSFLEKGKMHYFTAADFHQKARRALCESLI